MVLAPKRDVQARRAGAWAGVGSGRREILMLLSLLWLEVVGVDWPENGIFVAVFKLVVDEVDGGGWVSVVVVVDIFRTEQV